MTEEELLDFTELDDSLVSFSFFEDDDIAISLLDEFFWMLELEDFAKLLLDSLLALRMTEEELNFSEELLFSTLTGSSSGLTDLSPFSPHAARNNNIKHEIAIYLLPITISKLIKPSKLYSAPQI